MEFCTQLLSYLINMEQQVKQKDDAIKNLQGQLDKKEKQMGHPQNDLQDK